MRADQKWTPTHVEIEPSFDAFVATFRGGQLIRNLITNKRGQMPLKADYLFAADNVVAELKCLEKNPMEASDWPPRLAKAFRTAGHNFSDLMGYLVRGEPMPHAVREKLFHWLRDAIRTVVKGGNRQIRASKRELGKTDAKGVLLVANDNNYGLGPAAIISDQQRSVIVLRAIQMKFHMSKSLRFWVDVECERIKNHCPDLPRTDLLAQILGEFEEAGDAMRYLNTKGEIAWKATPGMISRLADAEQEARDDLAASP